jgi:hypothetical protein
MHEHFAAERRPTWQETAPVRASVGRPLLAWMPSPAWSPWHNERIPATHSRWPRLSRRHFQDGSFDSVICNFGLGHFPEPEAALDKCVWVLVRGLARFQLVGSGISPPVSGCRGSSGRSLPSWG